MVVTEQEFEEWKQLPVTKKLMDQIKQDVERMKDLLIFVDTLDLQELQGRCKASLNLLNVEYKDLFE